MHDHVARRSQLVTCDRSERDHEGEDILVGVDLNVVVEHIN